MKIMWKLYELCKLYELSMQIIWVVWVMKIVIAFLGVA